MGILMAKVEFFIGVSTRGGEFLLDRRAEVSSRLAALVFFINRHADCRAVTQVT
jgi:hypothetical protein